MKLLIGFFGKRPFSDVSWRTRVVVRHFMIMTLYRRSYSNDNNAKRSWAQPCSPRPLEIASTNNDGDLKKQPSTSWCMNMSRPSSTISMSLHLVHIGLGQTKLVIFAIQHIPFGIGNLGYLIILVEQGDIVLRWKTSLSVSCRWARYFLGPCPSKRGPCCQARPRMMVDHPGFKQTVYIE